MCHSGRYDPSQPNADIFKVTDRRRASFILAPTHEEAFTTIVASELHSYKQLPIRLYQIGKKFRDEFRAKAGLVRAREFVMKDLYTFDLNFSEAQVTYRQVTKAYLRIFRKLGMCAYVCA